MIPNAKRTKIAVTVAGPIGVSEVIPNSADYLNFTILITGFTVAKTFTVQGSLDGANFFPLDPTCYFLPTPNFTTHATAPAMLQISLNTNLPGGLRIKSDSADHVSNGQIDVIMMDAPTNWRH